MKKNIFFDSYFDSGRSLQQRHSGLKILHPRRKKLKRIIIRKNGDKDTKMTIEVMGIALQ